ncbi:MAG: exodeoxyribonuclease III [Alphaproteobacteria bacterium]
MQIISWNINSLRLRLGLLKKLIDKYSPEIICLQEIKVQNQEFPLLEVRALGYDFVAFDGEKSYNGVAILSKFPLNKITTIDVLNYQQKRHIYAEIETKIGVINLHNFYVPAGGDIPDVKLNDKFDHKLKFLDFMAEYFLQNRQKNTVILGDFNIAPSPYDVWSHQQLINVVSHTEIEVQKLNYLQQTLNFIDCHRYLAKPDEKIYSWWSYRALDPMKSNRGRRLDHIWITPDLEKNLQSAEIFSDFRTQNSPSDHVPILINLQY